MRTQYADRPPTGFQLLDEKTPAADGDLAFVGPLGGRWTRVRAGQNIIGATLDELLGEGLVLALARPKTPNVGAKRGGTACRDGST